MENGFVMPDLTKPLNKELKKEQTKVDKIYGPFLMKFFGNSGMFTMAIKGLHNMLITRFTRLIEIVEKVYGEAETSNARGKKNEESDSEKKKKHWITEKWQKVIKSNFFQKTLGFLKGMASVSFITTLLTFLVLFRMGIIQKFLPWIFSIVGDAVISLIKFLPTLLKMFWGLLTKTLPKILSQVFRAIFKMLGIENETLLKFSDGLAKILPLLLAGLWLFDKISAVFPIFTAIGKVFSFIWTIASQLFGIVKLIAFALSIPVGWIVLIIAGVVLLGVLIWKFRKEIWDFLKWIGSAFNKYVLQPLVFIFTMIGLLAWDYIIKPLIKGFKWMFKIYNDYIIQPLLKGAKWVFNKFTEGFKVLTNFFIRIFIDPLKKVFKAIAKVAAPVTKKLGPIITAISDIFGTIKNKVTSVLGSISKAVEDIFKWFENVSAFGGYDWATMKEGDKTKFLNAQAQYQNDILVQVAQGSVTRQVAEQQLGRKLNTAEEAQLKTLEKVREENKDIDLATVLAAQLSGVMNKLDNSKWSSSTSQAVGFLLNNGATYQMVKK